MSEPNSRIASVLVGVLLLPGCLLVDWPGSKEPLDRLWNERMSTGQYGHWKGGQEWAQLTDDRIDSRPEIAAYTKYGILLSDHNPFGAGWSISGGMIGRVEHVGFTIELFGKDIARVHPPDGGAAPGRDYSYEFFLLVRPAATGRGQVIKRWFFPSEELALTIDPEVERFIRATARSKKHADQRITQNQHHRIDGYLRFDPATSTATVTITGLNRPFEERVDLSEFLRR